MSTKSKYFPMLKELLKKPAFKTVEAKEVGVPRHALVYFDKLGLIEQVAMGIYQDPNYESKVEFTLEDLAMVAFTIPNAAICLISALHLYGLIDQIPREYWLAMPHSGISTFYCENCAYTEHDFGAHLKKRTY